jgi:nucleoside phosphorylase
MNSALDILIIAPTLDEFNVSRFVVLSKVSANGTLITSELTPGQGVPTNADSNALFFVGEVHKRTVGVACLEGSGNLNAVLNSYQLLDTYRPRIVILVGIAAGKTPSLLITKDRQNEILVGDVVYNGSVVYSAYGKTFGTPDIEGELDVLKRDKALTPDDWPLVERAWLAGLRMEYREHERELNVSRLAPTKALADIVAAQPNRVADWQKMAKSAFGRLTDDSEESRKLLREWATKKHVWPFDRPDYTRSHARIHKADIASGEMVVASQAYQALFRHAVSIARGKDIIVRAFEMEAFGIARVCVEKHIPFITIRGISDPGDERKDVPTNILGEERRDAPVDIPHVEKDCHHLAAACLSATFTKHVICSTDFDVWLGPQERPKGESRQKAVPVKCLDSKSGTGCPTDPPYLCFGHYLQGDAGTHLLQCSTQIELARVYEGLEPDEYSGFLSKLFDGDDEEPRYHALLIYPYTARETVQICEKLRLLPEGAVDDLGGAAKKLRELAPDLKRKFKHFAKLHKYAEKARDRNIWVDRIVVGDDLVLDGEEEEILGAVLCGANDVPAIRTYYLSKQLHREKIFIRDDVVLLRTAIGNLDAFGQSPKSRNGSHLAFRYFERSEMLVVRGWECQAAGRSNGRKRDDLTGLVQKWEEEYTQEDSQANAWLGYATPILGTAATLSKS